MLVFLVGRLMAPERAEPVLMQPVEQHRPKGL